MADEDVEQMVRDKAHLLEAKRREVINDLMMVTQHFITRSYAVCANECIPQEIISDLDRATRICVRLKNDVRIIFAGSSPPPTPDHISRVSSTSSQAGDLLYFVKTDPLPGSVWPDSPDYDYAQPIPETDDDDKHPYESLLPQRNDLNKQDENEAGDGTYDARRAEDNTLQPISHKKLNTEEPILETPAECPKKNFDKTTTRDDDETDLKTPFETDREPREQDERKKVAEKEEEEVEGASKMDYNILITNELNNHKDRCFSEKLDPRTNPSSPKQDPRTNPISPKQDPRTSPSSPKQDPRMSPNNTAKGSPILSKLWLGGARPKERADSAPSKLNDGRPPRERIYDVIRTPPKNTATPNRSENATPSDDDKHQTQVKRILESPKPRNPFVQCEYGVIAAGYPANILFHGYKKEMLITPRPSTVYLDEVYPPQNGIYRLDEGYFVAPYRGFFRFHLSVKADYPRDLNTEEVSSCILRIAGDAGYEDISNWSVCKVEHSDWSRGATPSTRVVSSQDRRCMRKGEVFTIQAFSTSGTWRIMPNRINFFLVQAN